MFPSSLNKVSTEILRKTSGIPGFFTPAISPDFRVKTVQGFIGYSLFLPTVLNFSVTHPSQSVIIILAASEARVTVMHSLSLNESPSHGEQAKGLI